VNDDSGSAANPNEVTLEIVNELGLHARAATKFVQLAAKYNADVDVVKDDQTVNGKSIMGILMLVAAKGTTITIRTRGVQASEALNALADLVRGGFGESK
jgi:phosphocarrier protein HPr